jgi:hypothetical protein
VHKLNTGALLSLPLSIINAYSSGEATRKDAASFLVNFWKRFFKQNRSNGSSRGAVFEMSESTTIEIFLNGVQFDVDQFGEVRIDACAAVIQTHLPTFKCDWERTKMYQWTGTSLDQGIPAPRENCVTQILHTSYIF